MDGLAVLRENQTPMRRKNRLAANIRKAHNLVDNAYVSASMWPNTAPTIVAAVQKFKKGLGQGSLAEKRRMQKREAEIRQEVASDPNAALTRILVSNENTANEIRRLKELVHQQAVKHAAREEQMGKDLATIVARLNSTT